MEIARHMSSIKLGRRPWVIGVGVLPSTPESPDVRFPVINELDCMIDTEKNNGVMAVWGDLYKNPFTGGFFAVPEEGARARVAWCPASPRSSPPTEGRTCTRPSRRSTGWPSPATSGTRPSAVSRATGGSTS